DVVRVEEAVELVEAMTKRGERGKVPEAPFAIDRRGISGLLTEFTQRYLIGVDTLPGAESERTVDTDAIGIGARQQRRPGGGANRLARVEIREPHTFAREPVDVRRGVAGLAVATDVGIAHVVRQDQHDVGRRGEGVRTSERRLQEQRGNHAEPGASCSTGARTFTTADSASRKELDGAGDVHA